MNHIDPTTPRSPTESDVRGVLAGVLDPELQRQHRRPRDAEGHRHRSRRRRAGEGRPHDRRLPAAHPDRDRREVEGVGPTRCLLGGRRVRRDDPGRAVGPDGPSAARRPGPCARHRDRTDHPRDRCRQRQGWGRKVIGDRQPRGRPRRSRPHRRRARRRHLGLLDPPHARRHGPSRGREGSRRQGQDRSGRRRARRRPRARRVDGTARRRRRQRARCGGA